MGATTQDPGSDLPEPGSSLDIRAFGIPGPQGSKKYVGHRGGKPILAESSAKVGPWRTSVRLATLSALNRASLPRPWAGPEVAVEVEVTFYLPKPSTTRTRPTVPPDLDKLVRSTLDALVDGGALADDSLVTDLIARKRYESAWDKRGARIILRRPELTALSLV